MTESIFTWDYCTDRESMRPGNGLAVHLISQNDVTKRVNSLVKRKGAAVLIPRLILIHPQQSHVKSLFFPAPVLKSFFRRRCFSQRNRVHVHPRGFHHVPQPRAGPSRVANGSSHPVRRTETTSQAIHEVKILPPVSIALNDVRRV